MDPLRQQYESGLLRLAQALREGQDVTTWAEELLEVGQLVGAKRHFPESPVTICALQPLRPGSA